MGRRDYEPEYLYGESDRTELSGFGPPPLFLIDVRGDGLRVESYNPAGEDEGDGGNVYVDNTSWMSLAAALILFYAATQV